MGQVGERQKRFGQERDIAGWEGEERFGVWMREREREREREGFEKEKENE